MKDQKSVKKFNQDKEQLEPKPQSPNQIIQPEKINKEGNSSQNNKTENKKNEKSTDIKMLDDFIEHPSPLLSDCDEESTEEIKKNFYENQKKESLLIVERKKNLKANNLLIMQQKLKAEHDSLQLKENIGKVVLNCKFMNDKNLRKNNSQNCSLLIKPEIVVNNFMLQRTNDINNKNKFNNSGIIISNINNKAIKKNYSFNSIQITKNQKLIKHTCKNPSQHQTRKIIKIPLNLTDKNIQKVNKINKIPRQKNQLIINNDQKIGNIKMDNNNNKLLKQQSNKNGMNKIPLKKIVKIVPINDVKTIEKEKNKNPQEALKKINHNYINKIQKNYNNQIKSNQQNNNNNLNKIIIRNNYNTLNKNISRNNHKINLSYENPQNIIKMISPTKLQHNIRRSNEITLNNEQNEKKKRIPIPFKAKNNRYNSTQYYTISKDKNNYPNCHIEVNNSINNDLKINSISKIYDSYNDSEKENHSSNIKYDNCKKTIERGGKFNNISTTYVVIKNSNKKLNYPEPSLTIDTQNFAKKKNLVQNSSTLSLQQSPMNSPFQLNSIYTQKSQNQGISMRNYKSQNYFLSVKKNKSFSYQNENNSNYINYPTQPRNDFDIMNPKNSFYFKNKILNKPIIYKYNYADNLWADESYFSYFNTSGYNY